CRYRHSSNKASPRPAGGPRRPLTHLVRGVSTIPSRTLAARDRGCHRLSVRLWLVWRQFSTLAALSSAPRLLSRADRYDFALDSRALTEPRPRFSELTAFLEQVAAPIRTLDGISDLMCKCHLSYLCRGSRAFGSPISERASKAVHRQLVVAHAAHDPQ